MKQCYNETKYVLDPHGAGGYRALKEQLKPGEVGVFLETDVYKRQLQRGTEEIRPKHSRGSARYHPGDEHLQQRVCRLYSQLSCWLR